MIVKAAGVGILAAAAIYLLGTGDWAAALGGAVVIAAAYVFLEKRKRNA